MCFDCIFVSLSPSSSPPLPIWLSAGRFLLKPGPAQGFLLLKGVFPCRCAYLGVRALGFCLWKAPGGNFFCKKRYINKTELKDKRGSNPLKTQWNESAVSFYTFKRLIGFIPFLSIFIQGSMYRRIYMRAVLLLSRLLLHFIAVLSLHLFT